MPAVAGGARPAGHQSAAERAHKPDSAPRVKTNAHETGLAIGLKAPAARMQRSRARHVHFAAQHLPRSSADEPQLPADHRALRASRSRPRSNKKARNEQRANGSEKSSPFGESAGWGARAPIKKA